MKALGNKVMFFDDAAFQFSFIRALRELNSCFVKILFELFEPANSADVSV